MTSHETSQESTSRNIIWHYPSPHRWRVWKGSTLSSISCTANTTAALKTKKGKMQILFSLDSGHQGCSDRLNWDTPSCHSWCLLREVWRPWRRWCPWKTDGAERHPKSSHMTDRDGWPNLCLFFSEDLNCGSDKDGWARTWADLGYGPCHPSYLDIRPGDRQGGGADVPEQWSEKEDLGEILYKHFHSMESFLLKLCQILMEWGNGVGSFQWQYSSPVNHHLKWTYWWLHILGS